MAASSRWTRIQHRRGRQSLPGTAPLGAPAGGDGAIEAYGPGGTAILVELDAGAGPGTAEAVRRACARFHGVPGARGAVSYLFNRVGLLAYPAPATDQKTLDQKALDQRTMDPAPIQARALAAGAEDVVTAADGSTEVLTAPGDLPAVRAALEAAGLVPAVAGVVQRSEVLVELGPAEAEELNALLDALAEVPGVRDVWSNGSVAP